MGIEPENAHLEATGPMWIPLFRMGVNLGRGSFQIPAKYVKRYPLGAKSKLFNDFG